MIAVLLRDLRWRVAAVTALACLFYFLEPAYHQHGPAPTDPEMAASLSPVGISASLAYLAGLAMIVLLAGFISRDRRHGYARLFFAHPTSPLAFYALRWAIALVVALAAAAAFLVVGQLVAWGELRGGGSGLLLALLAALVYGALMAFFSAALDRGDAWVVFVLFLPTFFPQLLVLLQAGLPTPVHRAILFVLPPQTALQEIYQSLILGDLVWAPVLFVLGYATVWLAGAVALLRAREWG
jgi:hypothetical protein